jgi:hypothetical protein
VTLRQPQGRAGRAVICGRVCRGRRTGRRGGDAVQRHGS